MLILFSRWVVQMILETAQLGAIEADVGSLVKALQLLLQFEDKNKEVIF